jgi:hypothetical protein
MRRSGSGTAPARQIATSELREAKAGLGLMIAKAADAAYVCASAHVLNAALNRRLVLYGGSIELEKEVYSFKSQFGRSIENIIAHGVPGVAIYASPT